MRIISVIHRSCEGLRFRAHSAVSGHSLQTDLCQSNHCPKLRLKTKAFMVYEEAQRLPLVTKTALGLESKQKICMSGNLYSGRSMTYRHLGSSALKLDLHWLGWSCYSFALTWARLRVTLWQYGSQRAIISIDLKGNM